MANSYAKDIGGTFRDRENSGKKKADTRRGRASRMCMRRGNSQNQCGRA